MLGKIAGGRRRGWQRMRWLNVIMASKDISLGDLFLAGIWNWYSWRPGVLQSIGLQSRTWLSYWTELNWREFWGFPGGSVVKNSPANAGEARDAGSIPRSGRSPGGGNGNPLQYSCLENLMDGEVWQATVHWVTKSRTWLSDFPFPFLDLSSNNLLEQETPDLTC